jgi:hypothetical protein
VSRTSRTSKSPTSTLIMDDKAWDERCCVGQNLLEVRFGAIGAAYYAQWKATSDKNYTLPPGFRAKDFYFGIGPEVTLLIWSSRRGRSS